MKEEDIAALVRYRMEQAQSALSDARYLLEGNRTPSAIINRSYYAMFYGALALLQKAGSVPSKHGGVIGLFDREYVAKGVFAQALSKNFHKAFELRQMSDYKATGAPTLEQAELTLNNAVQFVDAVKAYLHQ